MVLKDFLNSLLFVKRVHKLPFVFNFWTLVNGNPHVGYLVHIKYVLSLIIQVLCFVYSTWAWILVFWIRRTLCLWIFHEVEFQFPLKQFCYRIFSKCLTVRPEPIWIKVSGLWQIPPQHQSTYLGGPESASIEIPPFRPFLWCKFSKREIFKKFWIAPKFFFALQYIKNWTKVVSWKKHFSSWKKNLV